MKKKESISREGLLFFAVIFILMCMFKIWFTLFIVFGYAMIVTLVNKRRNFCAGQCPLGTMQDYIYENQKKSIKHNNKWVKLIFYSIFAGYIAVYIFILYNRQEILWQKMLYLMLFSGAVSMILQQILGKRYWCINMCPLGSILDLEMKYIRNRKMK